MAGMGRKKSGDDSELRTVVVVLVGVGLLFAVVFGLLHWHELHVDQTARSKIEAAHRLRLEGRPVLLVVEAVLHPGGESMDSVAGRVDVVDATSGARIARAIR